MFSFWLRVLVFLYALWLLRRLIAFLTGAQKRRSAPAAGRNENQPPASHTVKDPVCGMYMDPRLAVRVENRKETVFFCSNECKEKYLSQSQ